MNLRRILSTAAVLAVLPASLAVAAPNSGVYTSTDLGGALLLGRASQSWAAPLNANQGLNDVFNSLSWDGANLGTQWGFQCGVQPAAQTTVDNRDANGTGTVVFTNIFQGGTFFLNPGPWGDGSGNINQTTEVVTVQYVNFIPAASVININTTGQFHNSLCTLTFAIANGNGLGDTDSFAFPAFYPALLDPNCGATRSYGSWGDVRTITMRIDCPVPSSQASWGLLKSIYR